MAYPELLSQGYMKYAMYIPVYAIIQNVVALLIKEKVNKNNKGRNVHQNSIMKIISEKGI